MRRPGTPSGGTFSQRYLRRRTQELAAPETQSLSDPLAALFFTGISQRVHTSIVNGAIVVRDGRLVTVDEEEIACAAHALSFRMLRRAGVELPWGEPPWLRPR